MALTDIEARLVADALVLRASEHDRELWFALEDVALPQAHALWQAGYLDRRWHDGDLVYRASDQAARAQELHAGITSAISSN